MAERPAARRKGAAPPAASGEPSARVLRGDALDVLAGLPDGLAQTAVTSPPYWGLRDYGVAPRVWGGGPGCRHRWGTGEPGRFCPRCGAWKGCLGLEPDPDLYVSHLVAGIELSGRYAQMARRRLHRVGGIGEVK
jgi:hypothetical protein